MLTNHPAFTAAAAAGDSQEVEKLLDVTETSVTLVDPTKGDGTTPLITASMMGHDSVVAILLENGADTEKKGINGATALQIAASMGHIKVMKLLLDAGANPDARHAFAKSTALHFAAEMGQSEATRTLCEAGADPEATKIQGGRPLHAAADSNQTEVTRILLNVCKAEPNALLLGDTTAMYLAASKGYLGVVEVLLENSADVAFIMPTTPIGSALSMPAKGDEIVGKDETDEDRLARHFRGMTQKGSDPSAAGFETGNGATALHAAVENGHIEVVRLFMKYKVPQTGSMEGATPLILAAMYNQARIAEVLIENKAGLNDVVPDTGNTALYHAVGSGFEGFVDVLIKARADLDVKNRAGATALMYACHIGRERLVIKLLSHGASPYNDGGPTCLHAAAERGAVNIAQTFLRIRPDVSVDIAGADGQTALSDPSLPFTSIVTLTCSLHSFA